MINNTKESNNTEIRKAIFKVRIEKKPLWTKEDDDILLEAISKYGAKNWKLITPLLPGKTTIQCLMRWKEVVKPGLIKGHWSSEEDKKLIDYVKQYGFADFSKCTKFIEGRTKKQIKDRWKNVLSPFIFKGDWNNEEIYLLFKLYSNHGAKWSKFTYFFSQRPDSSLKNKFYSTVRSFCNQYENRDAYNLSIDYIAKEIYNQYKGIICNANNIYCNEQLIMYDKEKFAYSGILPYDEKNNFCDSYSFCRLSTYPNISQDDFFNKEEEYEQSDHEKENKGVISEDIHNDISTNYTKENNIDKLFESLENISYFIKETKNAIQDNFLLNSSDNEQSY